ncbi:ABC transporter permease protein YxdM [Clostridium oryzae]|uniref:ABC transporter permease protein YxdM n=2 Tax=Clostridium oryzae TaxID=1450648 RepID=A0A1V4INX6_9CLOT|nr:ABC transporter permease protein YxdM [Clostridium oryzae]
MTLGCKYHVKKDHFISLNQVVQDDGYEHNIQDPSNLNIPIGKGYRRITSQGKVIKVLFNRLNELEYSSMFILNKDDYQNVKLSTVYSNVGKIRLLNFPNWRKTNKIYQNLNVELKQYNKVHSFRDLKSSTEIDYSSMCSSKISDYNMQIKSASFLLFLCCFVGILFFVSQLIMLHFKLLTEFDAEKIKYKKINKIGIQEREVSKNISYELLIIFILPVMFSILLSAFFCYCLPIESGKGILSAEYSIIIGLAYFSIQIIYYLVYKGFYIRKLINAL